MNAWALNDKVNPFESTRQAMFGSDISHWDVPDMNESVHEAWEQVERGTLTEGDFREFTFTNVVRLHAGTNPDFFTGTSVEAAAAAEIAADRA